MECQKSLYNLNELNKFSNDQLKWERQRFYELVVIDHRNICAYIWPILKPWEFCSRLSEEIADIWRAFQGRSSALELEKERLEFKKWRFLYTIWWCRLQQSFSNCSKLRTRKLLKLEDKTYWKLNRICRGSRHRHEMPWYPKHSHKCRIFQSQ